MARNLFWAVLALSWTSFAHATLPDWSVIIYAGVDEEEITAYVDPAIERLLVDMLPANIELLVQRDTHAPEGTLRAIRRGGRAAERTELPETDSASTDVVKDFFAWANANATGRQRILVMMTHSWGWKGIIQDFGIPGRTDEDTVMPLRRFSELVRASNLAPDVILMDSCVLGTAEVISELQGTSRYLVVSQRETPFNGLRYTEWLRDLGRARPSPRALAKELPARYVGEYVRGGALAADEGEYDVVTFAAIDMNRWAEFTRAFTILVERLEAAGFREFLKKNADWPVIQDIDTNADLVELLTRLPEATEDPAARSIARDLLKRIGYPERAARPLAESWTIPAGASEFTIRVQADELIKDRALARLKEKWEAQNQDLEAPEKLAFAVEESTGIAGQVSARWFTVSGATLAEAYEFRPWLAGTLHVEASHAMADGKTHRRFARHLRDWVSVTRFPKSSFMLSEAHTQGAPFIHGIGINLHPDMKDDEERSRDPESGLSGPSAYRALRFSAETGWAELILSR